MLSKAHATAALRRPSRLVVLTAVFLLACYAVIRSTSHDPLAPLFRPQSLSRLSSWWAQDRPATDSSATQQYGAPAGCPPLPHIEDVYVILKTGASEAQAKLPVHFSTTLKCVPDYVLYADFAETVDGHKVLDALDEVDPKIVKTNEEFDLYRRLKALGKAAIRPGDSGTGYAGWKLDKWKFLPVLEKAWRDRPNAKWFVFFEDDTYVSWTNLLEYLSHLDPSQPFYAGSQMQIGGILFAHGGSGFIVSNEAMRLAVAKRRADLAHYDALTAAEWAGDCVLGALMHDAGAQVFWAWPNFQGRAPASLNATEANYNHSVRCNAAVTYHHLLPDEIADLWAFETERLARADQGPMLHGSVFEQMVWPHIMRIAPLAERWDNLADETTIEMTFHEAVVPTDADLLARCRMLCEEDSPCMQYRVVGKGKTCKTSSTIQLGYPATGQDVHVNSGWHVGRIMDYIEHLEPCSEPPFVLPK